MLLWKKATETQSSNLSVCRFEEEPGRITRKGDAKAALIQTVGETKEMCD